jgi:protein-tyrosine phosphatase
VTTTPLIASILNLRDVGGLRTGDGRTVRPGRLFRSATPFFLSREDASLVTTELGIRTRIDLRSSGEVAGGTSAHLAAVEQHVAHLHFRTGGAWLPDESLGDPSARVASHYLRYLEHAGDAVAEVVRLLATPDRLPALVHCTVGKDRTGVAIAMTLSAIGVLDDEIVADYARTRDVVDEVMAQLRGVTEYANRIARLPAESLSAEPESMALFLRHLDERHGGATAYLLRQGVTAETLDRLAAALFDTDTHTDPPGAPHVARHD